MKTKKVFVLKYEGDVIGVFDSEQEAQIAASQDGSSGLDLWLIEETTYYTKEAA